jgi:O-antigen ligase
MKNINLKKIVLLFTISSFAFAGGLYLYQTNEIVRMRLEDRNKYVEEGGAGSGRLLYWETAVKNWIDDDLSVIFIGLGEEYANDKMEDSIGERLFAHSEFFQILQQEGLIGLTLLFSILFSLRAFIAKYRESIYYTTTSAIFIGIIIEMTFQGGFYFNVLFLLSIYLALLKLEEREDIRV